MITTEMVKEFNEYCEENDIKTASISVYATDSRIGYHGYVYGDCIDGISCHGATFEEFVDSVKNKVKTKQSLIDSLKQQLAELEA